MERMYIDSFLLEFTSVNMWGKVRLTYNYFRRGGYNVGSEDYRWFVALLTQRICRRASNKLFSRAIIQKAVPQAVFSVLNLVFIAFIQSVLLFAFSCIPTYAIMLSIQFHPEIQTSDLVYFAIEVGLVTSEWFSDGQQYSRFYLYCQPTMFRANR